MALSLSGERSLVAANPFAACTRWIVRAQAARSRRIALNALLGLDSARLDDLGISRDDVNAALASGAPVGSALNAARARRARA